MKTFTTLLLALFAAWPVQAQAQDVDVEVEVERQRIGAERAAADAAFEAREKACYGKFGVNDCLDAARRRRNEAVADLRRQEVALNDAERKRRAAERLQDIDARAAAQRQQQAAERRQRALAAQQEREARAVQKAGKRPAAAATAAQQPEAQRSATPPGQPRAAKAFESPRIDADQAVRNRQQFEVRQKAAQAHKAQVLERNARRAKSPASALPAPP